ncbi:MAG: hypothetical protein ALECFALPRED_003175 [Alectoria fallacina]|uniref:Rhodopsin domain-containing protein n=1 Tax=Alectoria fallacina TaxID=1903189 RepID=A0A8H3ISB5_9LECA|nr:MAG: hypothetical protein ALECFALPRED_003175 [Alectoria fallacina]
MDLPHGVPLDQLPGLTPPPGVTPNFVNPDNEQATIIATLAVCLPVATLFTALRMYSKIFIIKSIALEDYASVIAWAIYVAFVALSAITLQYGDGIHQWDVPLSNIANIIDILYCPLILATKLAILLQIEHVFVTSRSSIRFYLVQFLIWNNTIYYTTHMFLTAFQCSPRAKIWNPLLPGHCFTDSYTLEFVTTVLNVISDVAVLVMPVLWVWKLQMAWKRKLGLSLIFASGVLACLSSILRLFAFLRWGKETDVTWYLLYDRLWTDGEITSGIICGCLPTLPRAFIDIRSKISDAVSSYRGSEVGDSGGSQLKKLRALGVKRPSASIPHSDGYLELTNQNGGRNNRQTFPMSKRSAEHSESESKLTYTIV